MIDGHGLARPAITVLGDVAVRDSSGLEVTLSSQRRDLLAIVAAAAGALVPMHTILLSLWGEDTARSRGSLKTQVSTIRKSLDRGLSIENAGGGYRLRGPLDLLDSTRFEQLVAGARDLPPADAARQYALALAQWHGPLPFANIDNLLVDPTSWRLLALRDEVVLALADAELASRTGSSSVALLEQMFADDPSRGDVVMRLARLYALATRQVEAVRVIRSHSEAIADIGAVIAPEVAELESQILRHEIGVPIALSAIDRLSASSLTAARLPRAAWVDRIVDTLDTEPVLLMGDPGVGKTILTRLIGQRLTDKNIPVVRTAALADPFRPMQAIATIIEALSEVVPHSASRALRSKRLANAATRVIDGPATASLPPTTRDELLVDLTDLIDMALAGTGAVLIVEDAQWLDAISAEIVASLSRRGLHLLLTSRSPTHPTIDDAIGDAVAVVPPFDLAEVGELLRQTLPLRANENLGAILHHQTGGNPLFLSLLLDVLGRGEMGTEVPLTLQEAVAERTAGLARTTRELLQLAALLGQSFPLPPLRLLRRRTGEQLAIAEDDGLIQLEYASSTTATTATTGDSPVQAADHGPHSGRFVHGLVADALAAMVPLGSRVSWHDELCRALQTCTASSVAIAPQAIAAADLDPIRAARACCDAAHGVAALFDWDCAIDWARQGLSVVSRFNMTGQLVEAELRCLLGTSLRRTNRPESDLELLRAAELASEYEADDLLVRTVTELCLHGFTTHVGSVDERARRHLEYALSLELPDHARAELLSAAATLLASSPDSPLGRSLYLEARDIALRSESEHLIRSVMMNSHLGLAHPDDLPLRWHAADQLAGFADVEAHWEAAWVRFGLGLVTADRELVDSSIERLRVITPEVRRRTRDRGLLHAEAAHAFVRGDLEEAERLAVEGLDASLASYPETWSISIFAALMIPVREAQGRLGELWDFVDERSRAQPEFTSWLALKCAVADSRDDHRGVRALLDVLTERKLDLVEDTTWTAIASMICTPIWRAADTDLAEMLYERLLPYAGQMTWNGISTHGPVDGGLALLAATMGDHGRAHSHLVTARQLVTELDAPHLWRSVLDDLLRA